MRHKLRGHIVAMTGEFVGTFLFLFFALGGTQVANSIPNSSSSEPIMYISLCFGFSLLVNVWVFYRVSGGLFNPAVSHSAFAISNERVLLTHHLTR
jgi:aquaporin related protein